MLRFLLAVVLAGTAMFGWAWAYHQVLLTEVGKRPGLPQPIRTVQGDGEAEISKLLDKQLEGPGTYRIGLAAMVNYRGSEPAEATWVHMAMQYGQFLLAALLAGVLLQMAGLRWFLARLAFVFLLGLFAVVLIDPTSMLWWEQSWEAPAYNAIFHISCVLIAAIFLAAVLRPSTELVKVPVRVR